MPRQHPSFTRSVLSPRVIVLVGVSGETRPERGRRRLRLTAGGRNWADVSFKVGQGSRCVGMRCFPSLLPSLCVCTRVCACERDFKALSNWHISAGARHLDFWERSIFSSLQLEVGLKLLRRDLFSRRGSLPSPSLRKDVQFITLRVCKTCSGAPARH